MPCDTGNDLNLRSQEVDVRSFGSTKSDEFIMADFSGVSFFKLSRHVTSHGCCSTSSEALPNWTKVSLRTTRDWRIKFERANEKHSSEQVLHFPIISHHITRACFCTFPEQIKQKIRKPKLTQIKFHETPTEHKLNTKT